MVRICQRMGDFVACGFVAWTAATAGASTVTFNYSGGEQTWVVPGGVTLIQVDAFGAAGAAGGGSYGGAGALGGRLQTTVAVTAGETVYVYVGGAGSGTTGGFNGGGNGGPGSQIGGAGGGASDVRRGGNAVSNRVAVAGGGGGGGAGGNTGGLAAGGAGGGASAANGSNPVTGPAGGGGGTQAAGGSGGALIGSGGPGSAGGLGSGGAGGTGAPYGGGGGGGGYYGGGGGGGSNNDGAGGGGGGSSYSAGSGTTHTAGVRSGNGQVTFTWTAAADTDSDGVLDGLDNCPTVYNPGQEDCDSDGIGDACDTAYDQMLTFDYTGGQQTWTVPGGVTQIQVDAFGAAGVAGGGAYGGAEALGGRLQTTVAVTPGETVYVYVGGAGSGTTGGFNGGGNGGPGSQIGGAGGGASDVRRGGNAVGNRVAVAGGGGGGGAGGNTGGLAAGGAGGGASAANGSNPVTGPAGGGGGTQAAGGNGGALIGSGGSGSAGGLGSGGAGGTGAPYGGGGGGGGYYGGGGGGGSNNDGAGGGGGGSSYSAGSGTTHTAGVRSGNGRVVISFSSSGADADMDGRPDGCDNCPNRYNPTQADADTDGVGDACDICAGFNDHADADSDGVPDGCDQCPGSNDHLDCNSNGRPDGCDLQGGTSLDCNANQTPDECETSVWIGADGASFAGGANWNPAGQPQASALLQNTGASDNRSILPAGSQAPLCGTLTVQASGVGRQIVRLQDGSLLTAVGGTRINAGGEIEVAGGELGGGAVSNAANTLSGFGTVSANVLNNGLIDGRAGVNDNLLLSGGAFENRAGARLRASLGSMVLVSAVAPVQAGEVEARALGAVQFGGALTNSAGGQISLYGGAIGSSGSGITNAIGAAMQGFGTIDCPLDNRGAVTVMADLQIVGNLANSGTVTLQNGILTVIGSLSGSGTIIGGFGGRSGESGMKIDGSLLLSGESAFMPMSGTVEVAGDFDVAINGAERLDMSAATLQMNASCGEQRLEALSADLGKHVQLPNAGIWSIDRLRIGPSRTTVRLANRHANSGRGLREALYARRLVLDPGVTLDLAGLRLYYGSAAPADPLSAGSGARVIDSVGGGALVRCVQRVGWSAGAAAGD